MERRATVVRRQWEHPAPPTYRRQRRKTALAMKSSSSNGAAGEKEDSSRLLLCTALNGLSGALLGPNLDNYHSAFGVLKYVNEVQLTVGDMTLLRTAQFVPPLFGLAGVIIGGLYIGLDSLLNTPADSLSPHWPKIWRGISYFCFVYWLSGLLAGGWHCPLVVIHATLALLAVGSWTFYDGTRAGAIVAVATGLGGPAIELFLINGLHLYSYLAADWYGISSWIPWVYAAGAPAVGNLARGYEKFAGALLADEDSATGAQ